MPSQQASPPQRSPDVWYPFGKSGAGAPLVDKDGKPDTTIYGRMHHEVSWKAPRGLPVRLCVTAGLLDIFAKAPTGRNFCSKKREKL